jgi:hypothetical protein
MLKSGQIGDEQINDDDIFPRFYGNRLYLPGTFNDW